MVRLLIGWALNNPLVVILLSCALVAFGVYAFLHVNVEAYPDPAPPLVEVIAQFPGGSAEEVERQVTVPLEVTLAGMPGLQVTRSKSLFGLSDIHCQFEYGTDYLAARQEVINRLQFTQPLPPGVQPQLSPESPTGEIYRYTLNSPKDGAGKDIYTLNDLKALQDWVLEREFRRVQRIVDITSFGGTVKRYEIHPDPDKLKQLGITLGQIQAALTNANQNVGGDYVIQGPVAMPVRSVGLFGAGQDPVNQVLGMKDPDSDKAEELEKAEKENHPDRFKLKEEQRVRLATAAAKKLREEEADRIREIRNIVITSINSRDIRIDDVVEGPRLQAAWFGLPDKSLTALRKARVPDAVVEQLKKAFGDRAFDTRENFAKLLSKVLDRGELEHFQKLVLDQASQPAETPGQRGVVVGNQTRLGRVSQGKPLDVRKPEGVFRVVDDKGRLVWRDEEDKVQCIVLLRKGEDSLPALKDVEKKVAQLNDPAGGKLLPGVFIEPYYDRTELINVTTDTVQENLLVGIMLVMVILFMFISNVRTALIVAINIPLALLFAFAVLFLRGKSANLLSIGAVDFGIIVDSSVIMVENIYRHISS
ncbi:MAG TPA: efflux RND transporter permease subunit, partial [Gemmataceae bacterium]|nr:efflux RND transporter permease subunit [Gemmataceae bacterium]